MSDIFLQTAHLMRQGKVAASNQSLGQLFRYLSELSPTLSQEKLQLLNKILVVMEQAKQLHDWLYLADIIEYELPQLMNE
ncbi:hypothetical protein [Motilimonas eburnea]|uniref:hypothetical protein n=1 Tax=Motilimonas eburnea TaxID=1737488 RepID=UPI001E4313AA|nr:hypothetical protein [Motilimonas eburnea]MCE2571522.1 hypothetical protein [Motilimonas eburnea]